MLTALPGIDAKRAVWGCGCLLFSGVDCVDSGEGDVEEIVLCGGDRWCWLSVIVLMLE